MAEDSLKQARMNKIIRENEAQGVKTEVYEWEFPNKLEQAVPMTTVKERKDALLTAARALHSEHEDWSDDEVRDMLRQTDEFAQFEDTHPHLFKLLTRRNLPIRLLKHINNMIRMRESHETGTASLQERTAQVSEYFNKNLLKHKI